MIYALLEPNTRRIRYVGSTVCIADRIRLHWSQRSTRQTILAAWLRTLDVMPDHHVLEEVPVEQRWDAEAYYTGIIRQIVGNNLLNVHDGTKIHGSPRSDETKQKISGSLKGRSNTHPLKGSENGSSKLSEDDVLEIRSSDDSLRVLAARYGVSHIAIHAVRLRHTWTHI